MNKVTKVWLMTAALLILIGSLVIGCAMVELKGDFIKMTTKNYETNRYEIYENYWDISLVTDTADVEFLISDDGTTKVTCFEERKMKHSVAVKDGALVIELLDTREWYDHIQLWGFRNPKITVYLPEGEYGMLDVKASTGDVRTAEKLRFGAIGISLSTGDVKCLSSCGGEMKIHASTGDITVSGVSAGVLDLSVSTGKVTVTGATCEGGASVKVSTGKAYLSDVTCTGLVSSGSTGDLHMTGVIASEEINVRRTTGDIRLEKCDAAELYLNTDTGDVTGTLLSEKVFIARSNTGKINVPETAGGGKCKVRTDTGNIKITVEN